jgi:hypothetical protein
VGGRKAIAGGELCVFKNSVFRASYTMDKKGVEFHIEGNDFFGTLATVLSLVAQDLKAGRSSPKKLASELFTKSDELVYLQERYCITRRTSRGI